MTECYLWTHEPEVSAEPVETLKHIQHVDGDTVFEAAVVKLENGKFLFISFSSDVKSDENIGITDLEEFDILEDAVKVYNETVGG